MNAVLEPKNEIVEFNEFAGQLAEFKGKYDGVVYDLTIPEDEKQARADRLTIGKVIANLDRKHRELKAPLKERTDLIDSQRKRIKDDLLNVQGKIKSQIKAHDDAIQEHAEMLQSKVDVFDALLDRERNEWDSGYLAEQITALKEIVVDDSYEHRKADATLAQIDTIKRLEALLADRVQYEAEQAELEALRVEKEERERKDREDAIRKEAEEKARKDAEAKADIEKAERKAKEEEKEHIRLEAGQRAEREKKAALEESERRASEAEARGRREAEEAHAKAGKERADAKRRDEELEAKEAAKKEKQAYRNRVHKAAKESLIANGINHATDVVTLVKDGKIKNMSIIY